MERIDEHRKGKGKCTAIQNAITKYGFGSFKSEIIYYPDMCLEMLNELEKWYIIRENSLAPNGYNLRAGGKNGGNLSEELRQKLSKVRKGRKHSAEALRKLSETRKGKKHSFETKQKMSKSAKKRWARQKSNSLQLSLFE